jgi:hypothetical protein
MIPGDPLHQRPDLGSARHAPEVLFDDRAGEPGARIPSLTDPTWREAVVMLSVGALLVLTVFAVHPGPHPDPTVNMSKVARVPADVAARPDADASDGDYLAPPCFDPERPHEKCRAR